MEDDALLARIIERLDLDAAIRKEAQYLTLAACESDDALAEVLGGSRPARPATAPATEAGDGEPSGAYLGAITVEGFRGIGRQASLALSPGVGLTLVVGRNGSGKSSFAEALEVLLTGDNQRWAAQSKVWKEGWRNLHHSERRIEAMFPVEGLGEVSIVRTWDAGAVEITDSSATAQAKGKQRGSIDDLHWREPLASFRPFLSYNELGRMLDEGPSHLYDALSSILGLEELVTAHDRLGAARRSREKRLKDARARLRDEILPMVEGADDERAAGALTLLGEKEPDLEQLAALATGGEEKEEQTGLESLRRLANLSPPLTIDGCAELAEELRGAALLTQAVAATAAERARDTAALVRGALEFHQHHGGTDCPVCGTAGVLDETWLATSDKRLAVLDRDAEEAERAARSSSVARERVRHALAVADVSDGLAGQVDTSGFVDARRRWMDVDLDGSLETLAQHVESVAPDLIIEIEQLATRAHEELANREDAWRPVATELASWVAEMRDASSEGAAVADLKQAEEWLKDAAADLRAERFAPLAEETKLIWQQLRAQSSVELVDVVLTGSASQRRVELSVNVDGVEGAALGVMSQGELHSLALSLFFPRATLPESPFRFVVIDDPVQSMDPVRVDGLARVLEEIAKARQVVVFTHDDRLPSSVRQLGIDATILEVTRRADSVVEVREALDPVRRYIQDCRALLSTEDLPDDAAARVVPGMCRLALEAVFLSSYRTRQLTRGTSHLVVEAEAEKADSTRKKAALGLFGDITRTADVMSELNKIGGWAGTLFKTVQSGSHTIARADLAKVVDDTKSLASRVAETYG